MQLVGRIHDLAGELVRGHWFLCVLCASARSSSAMRSIHYRRDEVVFGREGLAFQGQGLNERAWAEG